MSADNDDIFDENFDDFDEGGADTHGGAAKASGGKASLLDVWNSNPLVKLAVIAGLVVIGIGSVYAFMGSDKDKPMSSTLGAAPEQSEAPGGVVSENYGDALEEQNQQKLEQALGNRNVSAIPIPVNRGDTSLTVDGSQDANAEDPLAIWQRENRQPEAQPQVIPEPTIPPPPPQPVQVPEEQTQAISQAIAQQIQSILENRAVKPGQYQALSLDQLAGKGLNGDPALESNDPRPETGPVTGVGEDGAASAAGFEEILVPAGTILYGQILNEANSDTPGPIVAQVLSGPFAGSRMIGKFRTINEKNIISFDTAVINGVGTQANAVAIDPSTTSPGIATSVDKRYFKRVFLPAAARFVEGLGSAYAEKESRVSITGDVIVTQEPKLNTKQQFAKGIERGASKAGDILDEEADKLEPLIRVEAGTPVGLVLVDPIIKPRDRARFNPASAFPSNQEGQL